MKTGKYLLVTVLALFLFLLHACSPYMQREASTSILNPLTLQKATETSAVYLFEAIRNDVDIFDGLRKTPVLVDTFIDAYSQEQLLISQQLVKYLERVASAYRIGPILPLSRETLLRSRYVIQGSLALKDFPGHGKHYYLQMTARNIRTGKVVASTSAWVSNLNLNYQRLPEFQDSPVYAIYPQADQGGAGNMSQSLSTQALLNDAGEAYGNKQYARALSLYQQAANKPDGKTNRAYSGLYLSHLRLGNKPQADQDFEQLLSLNFQRNNKLLLKILFKVDSTAFYGNSLTSNEYSTWIQKIAGRIQDGGKCLKITGHSSHSGSAAYNEGLSMSRADAIKQLMLAQNPGIASRLYTEGKGFRENIIGSGTDDDRDMLDRRIEFSLPSCGNH